VGHPIEIFCYAAEADLPLLDQLITHLSPPMRQNIITLWKPSHIQAGAIADQETQQHLASARIFLLLISAEFLANDYCYDRVMKVALERCCREEGTTIPVLVRPVNRQNVPILQNMQMLPRNGWAISEQPNRDHALSEVTNEILAIVQKLGESGLRHESYGRVSSPQAGNGLNTGTLPLGPPPAVGYPSIMRGNKISSPLGNMRKIGIILLVTIVVTLVAFALYPRGSSNSLSGNTPYGAHKQISPARSVTTPVITQNMPATVSLSSPTLPLKIPCVQCDYPQLGVTVKRVDIDTPAQSTLWVFSFLNNSSSSCSPSFSSISLTDQSGTNYSGQGQVTEFSTFAIAGGQSVDLASVFAVLPASGTEYTLTLQIMVVPYTSNAYQTENFTFA
jgi:hypothetical protein